MRPLSTDAITDVLEGGASIPEIAQKLGITLADFLDWFFTEPVQIYIAKYRAANHLIAEARASAHASALIDRLRQQMGHPDPSLSIRASNTLARFVLREMPHHSRKSTLASAQALRGEPLPEQPGYLAGIERAEKARAEKENTPKTNTDKAHAEQETESPAPQQRPPQSAPRSSAPPPTETPDSPITQPSLDVHPAQSHPAPRDATPPLPSSTHSLSPPTQLQTQLQAREPFPLPDQSPHLQAGRTTPPPEACAA